MTKMLPKVKLKEECVIFLFFIGISTY